MTFQNEIEILQKHPEPNTDSISKNVDKDCPFLYKFINISSHVSRNSI